MGKIPIVVDSLGRNDTIPSTIYDLLSFSYSIDTSPKGSGLRQEFS